MWSSWLGMGMARSNRTVPVLCPAELAAAADGPGWVPAETRPGPCGRACHQCLRADASAFRRGGSGYGVFRTKYRYSAVALNCPREPSGQHAVPSTEPPPGMRWQRGEPSCAPGHGCEPRTNSATVGRGWNLRPSRAERMSKDGLPADGGDERA